MESVFNVWETNRKLYLALLNDFSVEQLNKTPNGFNNNLIWNIGHIIAVQQALTYKSSGLEGHITNNFFNNYKPGTKPSGKTDQIEIDEMKVLLMSLIQITKVDYSNHVFHNFEARKLATGYKLKSIEDSITFNNYHEAMQFGIIKSIQYFM